MDQTLRQLKRDHLAGKGPEATEQYIAALERLVGKNIEPFPQVEIDKKKYRFANRCLDCGTVILSLHRHDFVVCECWNRGDGEPSGCFIDGGTDYTRSGAADASRVISLPIKIA